jgi:FAD/FMN-containing dehydrogenase
MMKMLIGSFGTLAIIAEATFKVLPVPKASTTLIAGFASVTQAFGARNRILNSPLAPQALDFMDSESGTLIGADVLCETPFSLAVHAAGPEAAVERVRRELPEMARHEGGKTIAFLEGDRERQFWNAVQEMTPAAPRARRDIAVVKISVVLSQLATIVEEAHRAAAEHGLGAAIVARAGTGIVYGYLWPQSGGDLSMERMAMACETLLTGAERLGGYAVIEWCPFELKSTLRLWGPVGDDFVPMQRLKREFDPERILNPGRLFGKI